MRVVQLRKRRWRPSALDEKSATVPQIPGFRDRFRWAWTLSQAITSNSFMTVNGLGLAPF
jgi:hypothetical protein